MLLEENDNQWEKRFQELENHIGKKRTPESWIFINSKKTQKRLNWIRSNTNRRLDRILWENAK